MKITILSMHKKRRAGFSLRLIRGLLLLAWATLPAACTDLPALPTTTPSPVLPTGTPTATIRWFPPTNTPRQYPTQPALPTQDAHPGIGALIFSDSFDQAGLWSTATSAQAGAVVARNRLSLAFNGQGPLSVISLRSQPRLDDFYAEATADVSMCGAKDAYGMLFRAEPGMNYYRLAVNCNGQVRLERSQNGSTYPIQDWLESSNATFGAPAHLTLGVWVVGNEIRAFLNDNFQFSVRDPLFRSGSIGFFVYAAGKTSITASFSDLLVYSVDYTPPTPTATPTRTPKP
jgi:hypothetical protein